MLTRSFPAAIRRVREHRALGHHTVLITGALDFVVEPLRPLFDDIIAPRARSTPTAPDAASSTDVPPTGESPGAVLFDYAEAHGFDLGESRGVRRLVLRPADARGRRLPGRGEPRDPPRLARPQARLARRAVVERPPAGSVTAPAPRPEVARRPSRRPRVLGRVATAGGR